MPVSIRHPARPPTGRVGGTTATRSPRGATLKAGEAGTHPVDTVMVMGPGHGALARGAVADALVAVDRLRERAR
jgi:hypothetical protein